jgi:hypothetical protein
MAGFWGSGGRAHKRISSGGHADTRGGATIPGQIAAVADLAELDVASVDARGIY